MIKPYRSITIRQWLILNSQRSKPLKSNLEKCWYFYWQMTILYLQSQPCWNGERDEIVTYRLSLILKNNNWLIWLRFKMYK